MDKVCRMVVIVLVMFSSCVRLKVQMFVDCMGGVKLLSFVSCFAMLVRSDTLSNMMEMYV